jgi:hypothetical protein
VAAENVIDDTVARDFWVVGWRVVVVDEAAEDVTGEAGTD